MKSNNFSIMWTEFDRQDRLVTKSKEFKTEAARNAFISKLEKRSNFNEILAYES